MQRGRVYILKISGIRHTLHRCHGARHVLKSECAFARGGSDRCLVSVVESEFWSDGSVVRLVLTRAQVQLWDDA